MCIFILSSAMPNVTKNIFKCLNTFWGHRTLEGYYWLTSGIIMALCSGTAHLLMYWKRHLRINPQITGGKESKQGQKCDCHTLQVKSLE